MPGLSKNKIKILKIFYSRPEHPFYMQEIGRLIGKPPGVFQRTLNLLEEEGVLVSEYKANARFFRVNEKYRAHKELKNVVLEAEKLFLRKILVFLFCLFSCLLLTSAMAEEGPAPLRTLLSLDDVIATAFQNNKNVQIQEEEVEAARAQILYARSALLPQVNLDAGYTRNGAVPQVTASTSGKDYGVFAGYVNDNKVGVTIDQSIYTGGANEAHLKQSRLGLKVQEETLRAVKLDIEFEAKRLFYGLLLAYETERIAQELLDQAMVHYQDVKKKYSQGTVSRFDVLQSKVQVSKVMPEFIKAKNAIRLIKADLNKLLYFKVTNPIRISGKLSYAPIPIKESLFLTEAYLNKPEMILKMLGIDISKWEITVAKAGFRPQVSANAGYLYRSDSWNDMFNDRHSNWEIGIAVRVPLFDGFSSKAKVEEAKARYAQAVLSKEDLVETIAVEIRRDCLDMRQASAIVESQRDNVDEAREALRLSIVSYDNGVGTNLDVLDAQVSLAQIETNLAQGTYDYIMAKAALERTIGQLYLKEGPHEKKN